MGFLDFFVERDKKPAPKKTADITSRQEIPTPTSVAYTPPMGGSAAEFTEHFKKILKDENERNFPGNDYYEFYVVKSNMTALPEPQAYVVAFSGLAAAGLTKAKLLETAQKYLGIVEREMNDFNQTYEHMYNENVTKLEQTVTAKNQELAQLTQRISELTTEISGIKQDIMQNTQKLSDKKNGFMLAGNAQKQEIETEITKINQYVQ